MFLSPPSTPPPPHLWIYVVFWVVYGSEVLDWLVTLVSWSVYYSNELVKTFPLLFSFLSMFTFRLSRFGYE